MITGNLKILASENSRFSSLFAAEDVSRGITARNVPSEKERGEMAVFAGYLNSSENVILGGHKTLYFERVFGFYSNALVISSKTF